MPAYSTNAAQLLACALAFSVIKHRFQIDMYGFFPFFRNKKKSFSFVCFWCTGNSQVRMVWKKVCISQSSSPHLWITSRNYRRASKMNMHDLVKLILFILVKPLSPSPLYCHHLSVCSWKMRQKCSHKPQHTSGNFSCKHQNLSWKKLRHHCVFWSIGVSD